jgi:hypothetical protein
MSFSVGFMDNLFGEKIELELPDSNGKIIKRTVTKKWYEKMIRDGKFKKIEEEVIRVHMLHPVDGYVILNWIVGEDISDEIVRKFINDDGEIYALTVFKEGVPEVMVVRKDIFDQGYEQFTQV